MKIYSINNSYTPKPLSFRASQTRGAGSPKSDEDFNVFGYDDEISQERRNYIREHYEQYSMPYYTKVLSKEHRISDENIKQMINELAKRPAKVDYKSVTGIPLCNIRPIGNNSYRGQTLAEKPEYLSVLKEAGMERVIDLVGYAYYPEDVKKAGLDYHKFLVREDFWKRPVFKEKSSYLGNESYFAENILKLKDNEFHEYMDFKSKNYDRNVRSFIEEEFIPFIQTMQKGYLYIGCEYGKYKTDDALILNSYFNPKAHSKFKRVRSDAQVDYIRNLYNNLTDDDKKRLKFTKEFDESILPKLKEEEDRLAARWRD